MQVLLLIVPQLQYVVQRTGPLSWLRDVVDNAHQDLARDGLGMAECIAACIVVISVIFT